MNTGDLHMFSSKLTVKIVTFLLLLICPTVVCAQSRVTVPLKNLSRVVGMRQNQLKGFGIVVGLAGTGDGGIGFVNRAIANALQRLGIRIQNPAQAQLDNIAAVMVTATLPPFKKSGDKIDVTVSSIGSADDLSGGVLMQAPLKAANGKIYAVAQGPITKGGAGDDRHLTTVTMPNGALVEREVPFKFVGDNSNVKFQLHKSNFTTASRVARVVNSEFQRRLAQPENANTIRVKIPRKYQNNPVEFISGIQNLQIKPGNKSKIIINERTGTVVMGESIAVRPVAITHGDISIQVDGGDQEGASSGETVMLPEATTVRDVVKSLNTVGASTDAVIAILEALHRSGALNAPLELM